MKSNLKNRVIEEIGKTQDGKSIVKDSDDFSKFILSRIEFNTYDEEPGIQGWVNIEDLLCDFKYMINQLRAAIKPCEEFMKNRPDFFKSNVK